MEIITGNTPTQILKVINDIKIRHDALKQEIIDDTYVADELAKKINDKLLELKKLEDSYVELVAEMYKE